MMIQDGESGKILKVEVFSKSKQALLARMNLFLTEKTLFNLAACPISEDLRGYDLMQALQARGSLLTDILDEDGILIPAVQKFDKQSGHLIAVEHFQRVQRHDPTSQEAALQEFDASTGKRTRIIHYQWGAPEDPCAEEPAIQAFDLETGRRVHLAHYHRGCLQDPSSGEPAVQYFEAASGRMYEAYSYQNDDPVRRLRNDEIAAINKSAGLVTVLPKQLRDCQARGAHPV